jgi:hypothetical protein
MITKEFRANRAKFPRAELEAYRGQWIAFSSDGRTVLAGAATIDELENSLAAAGTDPQAVVLEHLPAEDICLGGQEL